MINTNKAVLVKFPAYTSLSQLNNTSTADICIPFPVEQINLKGIDLDFDADFRDPCILLQTWLIMVPWVLGLVVYFAVSLHQL